MLKRKKKIFFKPLILIKKIYLDMFLFIQSLKSQLSFFLTV